MTSPTMNSQDYLQRLRERRQMKVAPQTPTVETSIPATQAVETAQPTQVAVTESQPLQNTQPEPVQPSPQEATSISWTAPSRPFKKRNARFYTTITVIVVLISLILFFAGQFLPIAAVVAVAFLGYVLASVPPETTNYQIFEVGIQVDEDFYPWDEMGYFWLDKKYGQNYVQIEIPRFPFRLTLMLGNIPPEEIQTLLSEVLPERAPTETAMDRIAHWLEKNVLLDDSA